MVDKELWKALGNAEKAFNTVIANPVRRHSIVKGQGRLSLLEIDKLFNIANIKMNAKNCAEYLPDVVRKAGKYKLKGKYDLYAEDPTERVLAQKEYRVWCSLMGARSMLSGGGHHDD